MILVGIITAETQYPRGRHYDTFTNDINDLEATLPPHSVITQPSAHIFEWTMLLAGGFDRGRSVAARPSPSRLPDGGDCPDRAVSPPLTKP